MLRLLGALWVCLLPLGGVGGAAAPVPPRDPAILSYPLLAAEGRPAEPSTLLLSDSPETPDAAGVLYRDTVRGRTRVLAYHVNGLERAARFLVVARAAGASVALAVERRGAAVTEGPDPVIGQATLLREAVSRPAAARLLAAGETAVLYDSGPVPPNAVVSATLDLALAGAAEVTVLVQAAEAGRPDPAALPVLARDGRHQRGTFSGANRLLLVRLGRLPARLVLGGGPDAPVRGVDALTGREEVLAGNYGVRYEIEVEGALGSVLAASPRGGPYRGLLVVRGAGRAALVLIGAGGALKDGAAPSALWRPRSGVLAFEIVPANGSNLPLALVFYPATAPRPESAR